MSGFIQSYSGRAVTPLHLKPEQVRYEDIPHTLAQKVRFNGHLRVMGYSVAQHCVLGAEQIAPAFERLAHTQTDALNLKLAFLLHEVSEVYLPDVPAPIKPYLCVIDVEDDVRIPKAWKSLEQQHAVAMFSALGVSYLLPLLDSEEVKTMDRRMLVTEKRDLRLPDLDPAVIEQETKRFSGEPLPITISRVWGPEEAKAEFDKMYKYLWDEIFG